jgi:4-hydroxy-tetrahydrodipicolinate reductase
MNIALIGYGKMGKTLERLAQERGHKIVVVLDVEDSINEADLKKADVAIEFTRPKAAVENIKACLKAGIPIVSGTTGWLEQWDEISSLCEAQKGAFFYASNYSVGVNIFFELNKKLASLMNGQAYDLSIEEIHHTQKLDAPSGTAITLAEGVLENVKQFNHWYLKEYPFNQKNDDPKGFPIISKREGKVPGTHIIRYDSDIDCLEIKHEAKGREGFASGALTAAEWLVGKEGVFGMKDLLEL